MLHNKKCAEHPSLTCSLTSSFKAAILGSIMDHCSTQMTVSESQEREIGHGTTTLRAHGRHGPLEFGVCCWVVSGGGVPREAHFVMYHIFKECPIICDQNYMSSKISLPQRLQGTLTTIGGKEPWLPSRSFQYTGKTVVQ